MTRLRLNWTPEPLDWHHAKMFDRVIRRGDLIECLSNQASVRQSLEWAISQGGGESWAVEEEGRLTPVGVYGWTAMGAIWSYWSDLSASQTFELMRRTPAMVLEMVEHARDQAGLRTLANYVWEDNREALSWLKASHCFELDLDQRHTIGDKRFIAFHTKPVEELRHYV